MKLNRVLVGLTLVVVTVIACQKEAVKEVVQPPVTPPVAVDSTVTTAPDSTATSTPDSTITSMPPTDTTAQTPPKTDTTIQTPPKTDTTTQTPPITDTTTQTAPPTQTPNQPVPAQPVSIAIKNPGFEDSLKFWKKETAYRGRNGFKAHIDAVRTGKLGLNFYAMQPHHFLYAKQETPWNGKIYQTVSGLQDGSYTFKVYADAVGDGMYLWASGGAGEVKVLIKSDINEINTLDFEVKGGVARFGFICINAGGADKYAPYFHADDVELLRK